MKNPLPIVFLVAVITIPRMDAKAVKRLPLADQISNLDDIVPRDSSKWASDYDGYSAAMLAWQSLHMAAAAACRGSTPSGGSGSHVNLVVARNTRRPASCRQLCTGIKFPYCDAEVSIFGQIGKATKNGQVVAQFYNYGCNAGHQGYGRNEASEVKENVFDNSWRGAYSFCCCRK